MKKELYPKKRNKTVKNKSKNNNNSNTITNKKKGEDINRNIIENNSNGNDNNTNNNNLNNDEYKQIIEIINKDIEEDILRLEEIENDFENENIDNLTNVNNNTKTIKKKFSKKENKSPVKNSVEIVSDIYQNNEYNINTENCIDVSEPKNIKNENIYNKIIYNNKLFKKDRYQPKSYPDIIQYRCINARKNEHLKNYPFCSALIKRFKENNLIYYKLLYEHSKKCNELTNVQIPEDDNIKNYNEYCKECFKYLETVEIFDKKDIKENLLSIYNENKYNFKLKENTIENIIGGRKQISLRFT